MGAGCRKSAAIASEKYHNAVDKPFYTSHQEHLKNKPDFDRLLLSNNDLNRLFDVYCKIDQDFSGEISTWELLEYLHLERTKFTKRIFRIFDEDGSGQIDFREFVIALWNYCTLGKPALIMFAFDLYDQDGSGRIDFAEVELMLKEVYGRKYDNNIQAQTIRKQIHSKYDSESISVDSFTQVAILFPAFELQTSIQKLILGNDFWEEKANIRLKLSNGNYVSINLILKAHINNATFDELVLSNKVVNGNANRQDSLAKETIKGVLKTSGGERVGSE
ncbi:hypothetical protein TL16_g06709 [Triparma laevis f. inornata]|uniref:EF-hand domain-containing protein n=1 Tax=Triparma laevis f. inornata TaxID=1714386 RepID=A0A9W7ARF3_9STRA|nr:hypothetical protein TL16_g06709 [Triparma laevis f. inornata]